MPEVHKTTKDVITLLMREAVIVHDEQGFVNIRISNATWLRIIRLALYDYRRQYREEVKKYAQNA